MFVTRTALVCCRGRPTAELSLMDLEGGVRNDFTTTLEVMSGKRCCRRYQPLKEVQEM